MTTPSVTTINQTNTTTLPQWYIDYMSGITARGEALLGTDANPRNYDPNMDEQVAGLSDDELRAYANINAGQGGYNPYLNQATRMTEAGAQQDIYGAYSPYGQRAGQFSENAGGIDIGGAYSPYGDQANRQAIAGAN